MKNEGANKVKKPIVKLRSIIKQGSTYYIALPQEFIKLHKRSRDSYLFFQVYVGLTDKDK